jgi:transcription termination/antitermination protein NusA
MKQELVLAFNELLDDKQLPKDIILQALREAMVHAYKKSIGNATQGQEVTAEINLEKGEMHIFVEKEITEDVQNDSTEIVIEEARKIKEDAVLGDTIMVEITSTPKDFGRVAATTARQRMAEKIREAEHKAQIDYYKKQLGEIVGGVVQAISPIGLTIGLELKAEGTMQRKDIIPRERVKIHDRVRALVIEVNETPKGPQILLSRTHKDFLRRLLENEVPEIFHGVVEIRAIAREPGQRAKVAVSASQQGIDPVGACVGQRGVRIQNIVSELHNEKIDVVEYDPDPTGFIAKAIRPARVSGVYLGETAEGGRSALVVVTEDQLSLAIGRDGQNARLAAKLTNWRIDIKSLGEAVSDWLNILSKDGALKEKMQLDAEFINQVEEITARKAEGRAITAEEYSVLSQFVDRLERKIITQNQAVKVARQKKQEEILLSIPAGAYKMPLADCALPAKLIESLAAAGYTNAGDLAIDIKNGSEKITGLAGIGPKTLEKLQAFADSLPEVAPNLEAEPSVAPVLETAVEKAAADSPEAEEKQATTAETPEQPRLEPAEAAAEPGKELSFDEMFKAETLKVVQPSEEEEEEGAVDDKEKKKKDKKSKSRVITYDPDLDMTIMHKKHKTGEDEWEA